MKERVNKGTGKYIVFALLYIGWCISYIDRAAISIALASIGKEFQLSTSSLGVVLSTFFVGYAIMQIPGGWLADKFGSKKVVMVSILLWSVFTVFTGFAWSVTALIMIRFLFGLGEGAFPAASVKGVSEVFTKKERPKMAAGLMSSNYVGSAIAPLLIAPMMIYFGWRTLFHVIGIAGIVFVVVYWLVIRPAKVQAAAVGGEEAERKALQKGQIKDLLKMPIMWQLVIAWFGLSLVNKGLDSWMPTYLLTVRHLNLKEIGILTPLPFIAAGLSTAIGGWVMDRYFDGKEKYLLVISAALTAFFLYFMYNAQTVGMVITFQAIVYFFKSFVLAACMALPVKMLSGRVVGTAAGMINFGGQSAGFVSPVLIGFMITAFHGSYDAAFWFLIGAACLSAVVSLTIKSRAIANASTDVHSALSEV